MDKKNVVVIFGGRSSEHEVSCVSCQTIIANIDKEKYDIILIGITKEGEWLLVDNVEDIADGSWVDSKTRAIISPDTVKKELVIFKEDGIETKKVDVAFPVLHGLNGEDGTIQGIFELAQIPYVGCGVLASSVSMDKLYTKIVVDSLGVNQAQYVGIDRRDFVDMDAVIAKAEAKLAYPMFVKPSCAGSSKGISKADNREELVEALKKAAHHDRKILVEETITGREIECAVLGLTDVKASGLGEILAAAEFYDYDAKYNNAESRTVLDPDLPADVVEEIRKSAVDIFKALDGSGFSRVDFFVEKDTNRVIFNEINTIPGFTSISMYPMLWERQGLAKPELVQELLNLATKRYKI